MQQVLIVENESLLGAGIESLLGSQPDLALIGFTPDDEVELIREIRHLRPHIVILDEATYLTDPIALLTLLHEDPELRVVVVSADADLVSIYSKQQVSITQAKDLVNLIRRSYSPW